MELPTEYNGKPIVSQKNTGKNILINPCADKYNDKTYKGIYLGGVDIGFFGLNPAIYIPELDEIILGCESWWKVDEDLKETIEPITNKEIRESCGKMLKALGLDK